MFHCFICISPFLVPLLKEIKLIVAAAPDDKTANICASGYTKLLDCLKEGLMEFYFGKQTRQYKSSTGTARTVSSDLY